MIQNIQENGTKERNWKPSSTDLEKYKKQVKISVINI